MPSNQKADEKKLSSNQKLEAEESVISSVLDFNLGETEFTFIHDTN